MTTSKQSIFTRVLGFFGLTLSTPLVSATQPADPRELRVAISDAAFWAFSSESNPPEGEEYEEATRNSADRIAKAVLAAAQGPGSRVPFVLGNQYQQQDGKWVRFVKVHNAGKSHETMEDENGVNRYTQRDFGRCTGSAHDYSDPLNTPPLFKAIHAGAFPA